MNKLISAVVGLAFASVAFGNAEAGMKVRMGTEGAYPPFNSVDESGKLVGFDVDIGNAICDAAGFECTWVIQDWDGIIPGLLAKKFDTIIASMSITEERKEKVDFTDMYYSTPAKFFAKKGAGITISKAGLTGKTIGVQRATIHENFARDNYGDVATIKSYATQDEVYLDMDSGRLDTGIADSVAVDEGFIQTDAGKGFELIGPGFNDPKWFGDGAGIAVRKGEGELRNAINEALKKILADGTYKKINAKYFSFDVYGK
ncbi:MAG: ABC transporter substrate-binding protein [Rhodospirillaceae bacterium]|nr:ABC transporter substrate-binding protein [Rhodospirillaceae bacterium]